MDVREKLVELLDDMQRSGTGYFGSAIENKKIADYLIRHGVTVQDGKPLDAFLHPVDAYKGLKAKYLVFKADTGERVGNCFVLRQSWLTGITNKSSEWLLWGWSYLKEPMVTHWMPLPKPTKGE